MLFGDATGVFVTLACLTCHQAIDHLTIADHMVAIDAVTVAGVTVGVGVCGLSDVA